MTGSAYCPEVISALAWPVMEQCGEGSAEPAVASPLGEQTETTAGGAWTGWKQKAEHLR